MFIVFLLDFCLFLVSKKHLRREIEGIQLDFVKDYVFGIAKKHSRNGIESLDLN